MDTIKQKVSYITFDDIKKIDLWNAFILDTETTGFLGCPAHHEKHKLLQICLINVIDQDIFEGWVDHGDDFNIPIESSKLHSIDNKKIKDKKGKPQHEVMKDVWKFAVSKSKKSNGKRKTILFIAHCAKYDLTIFLKSFEASIGKEGENLDIAILCSCELTKLKYPEIKANAYDDAYDNKILKRQPYKLQSLTKHWYNEMEGEYHDAVFDCKCLLKIFYEKLLPKIWKEITSPDWKLITPGIIKPRHVLRNKDDILLLTPLSQLKFCGKYIKDIVFNINKEFAKDKWETYITNDYLITTGHLFLYGWKKTLDKVASKNHSNVNVQIEDSWKSIVYYIEYLLRFINVYSDETILEILSYILNRQPFEVVHNTISEIDGTPIFPSMPGEPISYKPFQFSPVNASRLYEQLNIKTAHDLYINYMCFLKPKSTLKGWIYSILPHLTIDAIYELNETICEENFKKIIPRLYYS